MDFSILDKISPTISSVLILGFFLFLIYDKIKGTSSRIYRDAAADYKTRIEQLEDDSKLNIKEIAGLRAELDAEKSHSAQLLDIIKDKNPEVLKLLEKLSLSNIAIEKFMGEVFQYMKNMGKTLEYQNELLEKSKERDEKLDKAHLAMVK